MKCGGKDLASGFGYSNRIGFSVSGGDSNQSGSQV